MGMADHGELGKLVPDGQALRGLVAGKDVVECLHVDGRPVAEENAVFPMLVRQGLQPLHVLRFQKLGVLVQRLACGVVVVRVVHASRHRSVVVAQHSLRDLGPHQGAGLVGARAVAHRVAKAYVLVDRL